MQTPVEMCSAPTTADCGPAALSRPISGGISRAEWEAAGAAAVYDDVAELLDQLDSSSLVGAGDG